MSLSIDCPSCGCTVSALAAACPSCGFPVALFSCMEGKIKVLGGDPLELIAMNPYTPPVILEMLCGNSNAAVHSALTRNPSTPEMLFCRLSNDTDSDVRVALLSSPYATDKVMQKISNDPDRTVIDALCQNPSTPEYLRRELANQIVDNDAYDDNDDDESEEQQYSYDDAYLSYHDGGIDYDGKFYVVMDNDEYGKQYVLR